MCSFRFCLFFFFNDTATTEIYTLSLHDALPICIACRCAPLRCAAVAGLRRAGRRDPQCPKSAFARSGGSATWAGKVRKNFWVPTWSEDRSRRSEDKPALALAARIFRGATRTALTPTRRQRMVRGDAYRGEYR